jgi:hypothetical protein
MHHLLFSASILCSRPCSRLFMLIYEHYHSDDADPEKAVKGMSDPGDVLYIY